MDKITPLLLYCAAIDLQKSYSLIQQVKGQNLDELVTSDDCQVASRLMDNLITELRKLNCQVAAKRASHPGEMMKTCSLAYRALQEIVTDIDKIIRLELDTTYAFSLSHAEAGLFEPAEPLLGDDVAEKFQSCDFDIEEAGKCHALGRSTGAVFHAFRVLEVGIKAVAQCLDIQGLEKPKMKNWGLILDAIKTGIEGKWPQERDKDTGDGALFWEIYTLMLAIKSPRNATMHPARKYTEQQADRILRIIGDIMMRLAERMDEKGEPKA